MKKRMTGAVMSLLILASSLAVSDSSTMGSALENEAAEHSESMFLEEDEDQNSQENVETDSGNTDVEEEFSEGTGSESVLDEEIFSYDEETDVEEEPEFTLFSEENAEILTGDSEEADQLIQEIENGEVFALSPALPESFTGSESVTVSASDEENLSTTALDPSQYYLDVWTRVYCDEVWTEANDFIGNGNKTRMGCTYRSVHYIDDTGTEKVSPLYCLKATKDGMDSTMLKDEAVKVLKNAVIQKLLYFGYGGPGDLGTGYDPSCSHISWSKWQNRYVFTHIALSIAYFNDRGYATEAEVEHVGINRLIDKIKTLTIPARNKASVSVKGENGWVSAVGQTVPLSVYRSRPDTLPYIPDSMKDGFQMSNLMRVTDGAKAGNGITITRNSTEKWQLAYWTSASEYNSQRTSPKMMTGTSLSLKEGAYLYLIFPLNTTASRKFSCKMLLQPVSYILVDGKAQSGKDGMQDFGAYVYQGTRGKVDFTVKPSTYGSVKLVKTEANTGKKVANAKYAIYAGEDVKSGYRVMYKKDQRIETGITDQNGEITYLKLPPGQYYVKEIKAPSGYVLSTVIKNVTVTASKTASVAVTDIMNISGTAVITKKDGDTGDPLAGAEFTLYEWSKKTGSYGKTGMLLTYNSQNRVYESGEFFYTEDNQGKFRIRETKAPANYTGNWQKDFQLTEPGTHKKYSFEVLNYQADKRRIEIRKTDENTGDVLKDAQFTLYEYSISQNGYKAEGIVLKYEEESQIYVSEELLVTSDNNGKFKIVETKIPTGYEGSWEQEIDITDKNESLAFHVTNRPLPEYKGRIRLKKTDVYTGKSLEDAEFTVYQWNRRKGFYEDNLGEKRLLKYDREDGYYYTEALMITDENLGKFRIIETRNPANYTGKYEKDVVFQKKADTDIDEILLQAENTPMILPLGTITVTKKIKENDITWAHGNPTFFFVAEGTDLSGAAHRYEDYVTFVPDNYETDGNGYATVSVTLRNIPLGQYTIWEKPVLRYYLKDVWADTENVRITKKAEAAYGKDPKETAVGTAALTVEKPDAALTFLNEKARYDKFSHTDCIKNTIPLLFS